MVSIPACHAGDRGSIPRRGEIMKLLFLSWAVANILLITRQVYNLFQEPVEQPPLGFSIAEEKNQTV